MCGNIPELKHSLDKVGILNEHSGKISDMKRNKETSRNLLWLCINKYLPENNINIIKETLLKSGVTFFNLHRMEKGYFPTSSIKFQVDETKTDISYLTNKNLRIGDRDYKIIR